jgi:CHAT domain-containing protein/Tfp pilus assembly protein PilF
MRHAWLFAVVLLVCSSAGPLAAQEGKPLVIEGKLTKDDPRDAVRTKSGHKVHEVKLEAGKCYQIDLQSKDFDPFLRLEDDQKKQLGFNDDIDYAEKNLDARLCVAPLQTGTYRLVVTSYQGGATGAYRLQVQALAESGKPAVEQRRLDKGSRRAHGRYFELRPLSVAAGEVQVVEAASKEFAPRLLLLNDKGQVVQDGVVSEEGKGIVRLAVAAPRAVRYQVVVTTAAEGETGAYGWRIATCRSPSSAVAGKGKADRAAVLTAYAEAEGLRKQGRLAEAVAAYEKAMQLAQQALGSEHPDTATLMNNLAGLYREQGQYGKAEPLYRRSLAIRESKLGKDHPDVAAALHNLGGLYREQGRYGEAEPLLLRGLAIWESQLGKDHPQVAQSLNNLAALYRDQGQFGKAEPLFQRSLAIRERKLGKDHPHVARSLNNLATLYTDQGQYGKAEPLYRRSLAIRESKLGKDHPEVALTLNNLATLYQAQGHSGKAEPLLQRSLGIWESQLGKDHPHVAAGLTNLAWLYATQEKGPQAIEALDRARRGLRRHLGRELIALPERDQFTFLRSQAKVGFHMALSIACLLRDQEVVRRPSAAWLVNGQALAQEALSQQTLLQRDSAGQPWAPLAAELHDLRRQLAALAVQSAPPEKLEAHRRLLADLGQREEELARRVAQESGRGTHQAAWLELDALRKSLPPDTALVAVARFHLFNFKATGKDPRWAPSRFAAWVIDGKDVHIVDLGEAAVIENEVQALGRELHAAQVAKTIKSDGEPDAEKLLRRRLDAVARRVLHPLLPCLKDRPRWLVCPDGVLWLVPWNALTLPDGKYVVEKYTVSHLVSGRDVVPSHYKVKPSAPVVLADPDFDLAPGKRPAGSKPTPAEGTDVALRQVVALGAARFARLPGTAAEAKVIAPKLKAYAGEAPKVYTEAEATESAFKALKRPKVLVLSTHGFFLPDVERKPNDDFVHERPKRVARPEENPLLRSGLALAGANEREAANKGGVDDGILTALEILQTDLRGTELVVLSACETGLGEVRNGEGVAGLRQAFQLAGAQSVLATLWQIPDRQTAQLMGKFFDHLAAGRGRAEALRLAQLDMIRARRQREGAAHPFFWAAFTLTGNWR